MKGKIIKDWSAINFGDKNHRMKFVGAMQHFFRQPEDKKFKAALQQFTTKGDFPAEILQVLEKYNATPDWDNGYEQIFDIRDFTTTNVSGFELLDVSSGLTFAKVPIGDKAKVFKMSGSKATVSFDRYGGALGWDRTWFDDRQWWTVEDTSITFRNKAYASRAANFYALIEAISDQDLAWQGVTADSQIVRDVKTINKACLNIATAVKDKGYGVTPNSTFVLLAPLALKDRVMAALSYLQQAFQGSTKAVSYTVKPVFTMMLSSNVKYYVGLPGKKAKGGIRMDLTLFSSFDILTYADTVAGWMRYGGAIGDTEQFQVCATS